MSIFKLSAVKSMHPLSDILTRNASNFTGSHSLTIYNTVVLTW